MNSRIHILNMALTLCLIAERKQVESGLRGRSEYNMDVELSTFSHIIPDMFTTSPFETALLVMTIKSLVSSFIIELNV